MVQVFLRLEEKSLYIHSLNKYIEDLLHLAKLEYS